MIRFRLAFLAAFLLVSLSRLAALEVTETLLDNGLKILTCERRGAPLVSVAVVYKVGSRNESTGMTGMAHFLEHMMFKGTQKLKAGDIDRLLAQAGADNNAFTDADVTIYHATLPAAALELVLEIEADRMVNCRLDAADLERERTVVLSELDAGRNRPVDLLYEHAMAATFLAHPYRNPVIGWKCDVEKITAQQMREFYRTYYQPNNAAIVIVGDFATTAAVELARKHFSAIPRGAAPPPVVTVEPQQIGMRRVVVKGSGGTGYVSFSFHAPPHAAEDCMAAEVLDAILSGSMTSRLQTALIDEGLAADVTTYLSCNHDVGVWSIEVVLNSGPEAATADEVQRQLEWTLKDIRESGVSQVELRRAKKYLTSLAVFADDNINSIATNLAYYEGTANWRQMVRYEEDLAKVSAEDVQAVARKYLLTDRCTVAEFVPVEPSSTPYEAQSSRRKNDHVRESFDPQEMDTKFSARTEFPVVPDLTAKVERLELPNGAVVLLCADRDIPAVQIGGYLRVGSVNDPAGQEGVAYLTSRLLTQGSKNFPNVQWSEALDDAGAVLNFSTGDFLTTFSGQCLKADAERLLELLIDSLRHPELPEEIYEDTKNQSITTLREAWNEPDQAAMFEMRRSIYGPKNPLGLPPEATEDDLEKLSLAQCRKFHAANYRPDALVLAVVGDFEAAKIKSALEQHLAVWPRPSEPLPAPFRNVVTPISGTPRKVLAMPGKHEVIIAMGASGVPHDAEDLPAALLANQILGGAGNFTALLLNQVRDQQGLTYGISSHFVPLPGQMPWMLTMQCDPEDADYAIDCVRKVIGQMSEGKFADANLVLAKAYLMGDWLRSIGTLDGLAWQLLDMESLGRKPSWLHDMSRKIAGLTREEVLVASRKYLPGEDLAITIAGPYPPPQPKAP